MPVVVYRRYPNADLLEDDAEEIVLLYDEYHPLQGEKVGADIVLGDSSVKRSKRFRWKIAGRLSSVYRSATPGSIDNGRMMRFNERFRCAEFLFVHRVYEITVGGVPARRADYDHSAPTSDTTNDTWWYVRSAEETLDGYPNDTDNGHLPMWVRVDDDPDLQYDSGGTYAEEHTLTSQNVFTLPA